jgi:MFS family permease
VERAVERERSEPPRSFERRTLLEELKVTLAKQVRLLVTPRALLLVPYIFAHTFMASLFSGKVPPRLEQNDHVGFLFACYGGTCFLGALSFGRLSDRVGRRPVVFVGFLMHWCSCHTRTPTIATCSISALPRWACAMRRFSSC